MLNHLVVGSNDLERSKRFYDAALGTLGAGEPLCNTAASGHTDLYHRHNGSTFCVSEPINGESATPANGGTIGFKCDSPEKAIEFHDVVVQHGGQSIEEARGLRQEVWGACIRPMCATRMAISSVQYVV